MPQIDPKTVHLIENEDIHLLFRKDTLEFFEIPAETADSARPIIAQNREFIDPDDYQSIKNACERGHLKILQLNISEDCNLNCTYCAADGGRYGRQGKLMSPEIARQAMELFFSHFTKIDSIQFFGGEPLLNIPAIKEVLQFLKEKQQENPEFKMPMLNINTNGTIMNQEIIDMIKENNMQVVVSIDGPPEIHNQFRPNRAGEDTFDLIIKNIQLLQAETGQPSGYELVYGTHFLEAGWDLLKTLKFLKEQVPTENPVFFTAPLLANDLLSPQLKKYAGYQEALLDSRLQVIRQAFTDIREGREPLFDHETLALIRKIMGKRFNKLFCGPCHSKLMIEADGTIVPCNIFIGFDDYVIGHVSKPESLGEPLEKQRKFFRSKKKTTHYKECATCWAFNLCGFCMGHIYDGKKPDLDRINPDICTTHRALAEETVLQIGLLTKEPEIWKSFQRFLKTSKVEEFRR